MRIIIAFVLVHLVLGCKTEKASIQFTLLEKHSGKKPSSFGDNEYMYVYREVYLADNLPRRNEDVFIDDNLYNILSGFFKKNNKICLLEDDITEYNVRFYRKSNCTEHFIENSEDYGGFSQSTLKKDCKEDVTYSFYYERDKDNPNMWTNPTVAKYWSEKYRDTIYCDSSKKKVKLPDMPN
jgi:hypothetical protein